MMGPFPLRGPVGAALGQRIVTKMRVILHIGAHRCATTTFQHYLRRHGERLGAAGIGFWGPRRTRGGLLHGLQPGPHAATGRDLQRRAAGRLRLACARSAAAGVKVLIISDENTMGTVRENLRLGDLYSGVGERIARLAMALEGYLGDVVMNIRGLDGYWSSALGYSLTRGRPVPGPAALARLADNPRGWRDVIGDIACAAGAARLSVLPFEVFAGRPEAQLGAMIAEAAALPPGRDWLNATPLLPELRDIAGPAGGARLPAGGGRWRPFGADATAVLRERYADDIMWLTGGAEGIARLIGGHDEPRAGQHRPASDMTTRGRHDDSQENARFGRLAGAG